MANNNSRSNNTKQHERERERGAGFGGGDDKYLFGQTTYSNLANRENSINGLFRHKP